MFQTLARLTRRATAEREAAAIRRAADQEVRGDKLALDLIAANQDLVQARALLIRLTVAVERDQAPKSNPTRAVLQDVHAYLKDGQ